MSWFIFVVFNILKHFNGENLAAILCKICKLLEWPDALRLMQHLDCDSKGFILLFHIYKLKLMYITTIFNSYFYATKDAIMIAHSIDRLSGVRSFIFVKVVYMDFLVLHLATIFPDRE